MSRRLTPAQAAAAMRQPPAAAAALAPKTAKKSPAPQGTGEVRIIGGQWKRTRLPVPQLPGLRPTPDRVRETLFNWLGQRLDGLSCLDLFAGSGALGFEALSRGAKHVTFIDTSSTAIQYLKQNAATLKINNAEFLQNDFTLTELVRKFDIVFLDPPYQKNYLLKSVELLLSRNLLNKNALIYFECEKNSVDFKTLPREFEIIKHKKTKTIEYGMLRCLI